MRRSLLSGVIFALCLAAACTTDPPAPAAQPIGAMGSPAAGLAYAEQNCASCHAVGPDQIASPDYRAPAFETLANTPGMTGLALHVWLQSLHPNMPHIIVEPDHVDDVWSYIASLEDER